MKILNTLRYVLLALIFASPAVQAELEITISGGQVRALPIAVVPFAQPEEGLPQSEDMAAIVDRDLSGSGLFETIDREDMLAQPSKIADLRYENWRSLGREFVVIGEITRGSMGQWLVEFHLLDVYKEEAAISYRIPLSSTGFRSAAHQIGDLIYEKLTGHKGVFNTRIAYVTASGSVDNRIYKLLIAEADGHDPKQLVYSREPIISPAWSPDGRQMAFVAFENGLPGIYLQTVATGQVRKLSNRQGINGAPAFSPDGRQLAVTLSFEGNPEIYLIDINSGELRRLTHDPSIDTEATFTPDGKHVVFTSDRAGQAQLYQVPVSGGSAQRLTFEGRSNARASFSPDGRYMVFVQLNQQSFQIALMEMATKKTRVLSPGPLDESPSFAPNGNVVIYSARGNNGAELATVTVDTGIRQQLRQSGDVREPAWSPFHQ